MLKSQTAFFGSEVSQPRNLRVIFSNFAVRPTLHRFVRISTSRQSFVDNANTKRMCPHFAQRSVYSNTVCIRILYMYALHSNIQIFEYCIIILIIIKLIHNQLSLEVNGCL